MCSKKYFRVLEQCDANDVGRLLEMYLREDEVSKCLNLSESEKAVFADAFIEHVIPQGLSVGLFDGVTDEMLGCVIGSDRDNYIKPEDYKNLDDCPQLQKLARFDAAMDRNYYDMFPDEKCALAEIMVVDPKVGRRGLSHQLNDRLGELAAQKGYTALLGVSMSTHIRPGIQKKGWIFDYTKEIKYAGYRDPVTGEEIFKNLAPNYTGAVPMFRRLVAQKL